MHALSGFMHSCTHTDLLHLHRVQTEEKTKKKTDDGEKNSLSFCQAVCLFMSGNTRKTKIKVRRWITSSQQNRGPVLTRGLNI